MDQNREEQNSAQFKKTKKRETEQQRLSVPEASATFWGALRARDGRLSPYRPFIVEIGNEQHLTQDYAAQVRRLVDAMEAKARALCSSAGAAATPAPVRRAWKMADH